MKARQRVTKGGTLTTDDWRRLNDLLGLNVFTKARILEGFINVTLFGGTLGLFPETAPVAADDGMSIPVGASIGLGPAKDSDSAWPIEEIWVKNTTAGNNAKFTIVGVLEVGE